MAIRDDDLQSKAESPLSHATGNPDPFAKTLTGAARGVVEAAIPALGSQRKKYELDKIEKAEDEKAAAKQEAASAKPTGVVEIDPSTESVVQNPPMGSAGVVKVIPGRHDFSPIQDESSPEDSNLVHDTRQRQKSLDNQNVDLQMGLAGLQGDLAAKRDEALQTFNKEKLAKDQQLANMRAWQADHLRKMQMAEKQIDAEMAKKPAQYDAATGGSTGLLGFIAKVTWALSSPDYRDSVQKSINSKIQQDYNDQLNRREMLGKKRQHMIDELGAFNSAYGNEQQAHAAWENWKRNKIADDIVAFAEKTGNPLLIEKARLAAEKEKVSNDYKYMNLLGQTWQNPKAIQMGGSGNAAPGGLRSDKGTGQNYISPDVRVLRGQNPAGGVVLGDKEKENLVQIPVGRGKYVMVHYQNDKAREAVREAAVAQEVATDAADFVANSVPQIRQLWAQGKKQEALAIGRQVQARLAGQMGQFAKTAGQGTMQEAEYKRNAEQTVGTGKVLTSQFGNLINEMSRAAPGAGLDQLKDIESGSVALSQAARGTAESIIRGSGGQVARRVVVQQPVRTPDGNVVPGGVTHHYQVSGDNLSGSQNAYDNYGAKPAKP